MSFFHVRPASRSTIRVWLFDMERLDVHALKSVMNYSPSSTLLNALSNTTSALTLNSVLSLAYYSERFYSDTDKSFAGTATSGHWMPIGYGETPTCEMKS